MRSICGALTRPSRRTTGRRSFRRTSVGTWVTLSRSTHSGEVATSIRETRRRSRSLRARWARRLSIRRAGPDVSWVKKSNMGVGGSQPSALRWSPLLEGFPCPRAGVNSEVGYRAGYYVGRGAREDACGGRGDIRTVVARLGAMELFDWYWL